VTYRLGDHTTSDDASRYRDDAQVSKHWAAEPVARLRQFLVDGGAWTKSDEEHLLAEANADVDAASEAYLAMPPQAPETIFDHTYATLPPDLARQRATLLAGGR
jgi:pyruvate dehydrogenase E1 component alpha subunit